MMKYIFSTSYDHKVYVDKLDKEKQYIGSMALLSILERELGLYQVYPSDEIRLKFYLECLKENQLKTFYTESLQSDQFNVAKQLLAYRDELVLFGWNSDLENQPKRLEEFSIVERKFKLKKEYLGVSDRWVRVLHELTEDNIKEFQFKEVVLQDNMDELYPVVKSVLLKIKATSSDIFEDCSGTSNLSKFQSQIKKSLLDKSSESDVSFIDLAEDKSLVLLKFKNNQELVDSMAFYANKEKHVFLSAQNSDFDFSLVSFKKSATGSFQNESNPQQIQIFKLIIPCFSGEFNIQTFLSFLQLSYSPIPYRLKKNLSKCLTDKPGIGNGKWNSILNGFLNEEPSEECKLDTKQRKNIIELFLSFEKNDELSSIKKAIKIIDYLINWSSKTKNSGVLPEIQEQFTYLEELCLRTKELIKDESSLSNVQKAFQTIYSPGRFTNYIKQVASVDCFADYYEIATTCEKTVVVLDFYNNPIEKDRSGFLLKEEKQFLMDNSMYYNANGELSLKQILRGLLHVKKQLILCFIEKEDLEKHPLHIRLEALFPDFENKIQIDVQQLNDLKKLDTNFLLGGNLENSKVIPIPTFKTYFESSSITKIQKREVESASSIEKFILYPFDWVLSYVLKMNPYQALNLPQENQIKGKIAHKVIENFFNEEILKQSTSIIISKDSLESEFTKVVQQEGAFFLQPERRFELSEFKQRFFRSFYTLIDIINTNHFKIVACEKSFGKEEICFVEEALGNINGFIDLLLEDSDGNPFVLDLKWTFSDKKFISKIEEEEAIQLALYTAALNQRNLCKSGYFLLYQNFLITAADLAGDNIKKIANPFSNKAVLDKMKKSIEFRWSEFKNSKIEIGDNLLLSELAYTIEEGLMKLPEGDKKVKEMNPYTGYELFKGTLK